MLRFQKYDAGCKLGVTDVGRKLEIIFTTDLCEHRIILQMSHTDSIQNAVECLKLPRCASMRQIQQHYRERVKAHHPDRQQGQHDPEMAVINEAYALLMDYCRNYKIPLDREPIKEAPRDWWKEQFGDSL